MNISIEHWIKNLKCTYLQNVLMHPMLYVGPAIQHRTGKHLHLGGRKKAYGSDKNFFPILTVFIHSLHVHHTNVTLDVKQSGGTCDKLTSYLLRVTQDICDRAGN